MQRGTALCALKGNKWMANVKQLITVTLAQVNPECTWEIVSKDITPWRSAPKMKLEYCNNAGVAARQYSRNVRSINPFGITAAYWRHPPNILWVLPPPIGGIC
ncbi:uncharacterized protein LOC124432384 [Vespa crabro]|uniref:uncharacterized protein LOC124432384 n=1 Tax=Vespa crabro TaxID=7445 RepID=UPI001EFFF763|nr:uncharacterized protein LOC124432384 [Vespa crabro]